MSYKQHHRNALNDKACRLLVCVLITYRTSVHSRHNGKSSAEVLTGSTVRTINYAMLPRTMPRTPGKSLKRVAFNVGDPVLPRIFRPGQTWIAGAVARRRGGVLYEIQVTSQIWMPQRYQLKRRQVEISGTNSIPMRFQFDQFTSPHLLIFMNSYANRIMHTFHTAQC